MSAKFPPRNALHSVVSQIMPSHYSNVAISLQDYGFTVHLYFSGPNKWVDVDIDDLSESEKTLLLEPYVKNTYQ